jgi:hypothetical protein
MFKYNLKFAWRNLLKDRQFTLKSAGGESSGFKSGEQPSL